MYEAPDDETSAEPKDASPSPQQPGQHRPALLSQRDPEPDRANRRTPILLIIIIVLLVTAFVVLHLTGVAGPGAH